MNREDAIEALMSAGRSHEQAEAFLAILGSAFRRRGWAEGQPMSDEELGEAYRTFREDTA